MSIAQYIVDFSQRTGNISTNRCLPEETYSKKASVILRPCIVVVDGEEEARKVLGPLHVVSVGEESWQTSDSACGSKDNSRVRPGALFARSSFLSDSSARKMAVWPKVLLLLVCLAALVSGRALHRDAVDDLDDTALDELDIEADQGDAAINEEEGTFIASDIAQSICHERGQGHVVCHDGKIFECTSDERLRLKENFVSDAFECAREIF